MIYTGVTIESLRNEHTFVAIINTKIYTDLELFEALYVRLRFPDFGYTWDGLEEVLRTLYWFDPKFKEFVIYHCHPIYLPDEDFHIYLQILNGARRYLAPYGLQLHAVFHTADKERIARLLSLGNP